jgi:hypothetical protein
MAPRNPGVRTSRQAAFMGLMSRGLTTKEIAERMGCGYSTVYHMIHVAERAGRPVNVVHMRPHRAIVTEDAWSPRIQRYLAGRKKLNSRPTPKCGHIAPDWQCAACRARVIMWERINAI